MYRLLPLACLSLLVLVGCEPQGVKTNPGPNGQVSTLTLPVTKPIAFGALTTLQTVPFEVVKEHATKPFSIGLRVVMPADASSSLLDEVDRNFLEKATPFEVRLFQTRNGIEERVNLVQLRKTEPNHDESQFVPVKDDTVSSIRAGGAETTALERKGLINPKNRYAEFVIATVLQNLQSGAYRAEVRALKPIESSDSAQLEILIAHSRKPK
jgi:hypothetical protein